MPVLKIDSHDPRAEKAIRLWAFASVGSIAIIVIAIILRPCCNPARSSAGGYFSSDLLLLRSFFRCSI